MNIISLIQPAELGPNFRFEGGVWKVNFPTTATPPPPISNDARNIIQNVGDGMFVDQRNRLAYAMVQDNQTQKIQLWQYPADIVFNTSTASMVSEIDMLAMNGQFDDIAIDEGVVTFTNVQTGSTLTLNTNELQRVGSIKSTDTVTVTETAGVLKLAAKIDPKANNLLEIKTSGLQVSPDKIEQIFNTELAKLDIHTQSMSPDSEVGLKHVIGDQIINIPKVTLANSAGVAIAMVNDPTALEQSRDYQYPDAVDIASFIGSGSGRQNRNLANFSLSINGLTHFASKPDLLQEDVANITNSKVSVVLQDSGIIRVISRHNPGELVTIVMSPSSEQRPYSNKFLRDYRGAKVLANGDLEFKLIGYVER